MSPPQPEVSAAAAADRLGGLHVDRAGVLIGLRGIADLTGINYPNVRQMCRRGRLPPPIGRLGQAWIWWADDVVRWDASGRPTADELERRSWPATTPQRATSRRVSGMR